MIYFNDTTDSQTVYIPLAADTEADVSAAELTLLSTVDLTQFQPTSVSIARTGSAGNWLAVSLSLPAEMAPGSYDYTVELDGQVLSSGCAQVGDYGADIMQYEKDVTYKQYER